MRRSTFPGLLLCAALLCACGGDDAPPPRSQDVTVLAQEAEGFEAARPGVVLEFPRDHGPHPGFRIEWWYLTANLQDVDGRPFGAQWTLFRSAQAPPGGPPPDNAWQTPQVWMAHFALTTPTEHRAFQRYARGGEHGGLAQAGAVAAPFSAWLDDWTLRSRGADWLPLTLAARQGDYALDLRLDSAGPLVLQGDEGFSRKHPAGGGSHYYSQPFLRASGTLTFAGETVAVTGEAWLDREWSSQFLQSDQAGWDWFALHLDSGEKLMLFQLRDRENASRNFRHGVLIDANGGKTELDPQRISLEPLDRTRVAGRSLPVVWSVDLPEISRSLSVRALHPDQWMDVDFPYWEGAVTVDGAGPGSRGVGYLEMTGYLPE